MSALIIGDSRAITLQQYQQRSGDIYMNFSFMVENSAEYTWFNSSALAQLPLAVEGQTNVIIMLGFNDCVNSCTWNSFNINTIADNYVKTINDLVDKYSSLSFYVCTVPPVNSDYPFSDYTGGIIPYDKLNEKITAFNTKIAASKAKLVDCYNYILATKLGTRDGFRYDENTCYGLLSYLSIIDEKIIGSEAFIPRLTKPHENVGYVDGSVASDYGTDMYWVNVNYGGLNIFSARDENWRKFEGDSLPNSTAYAWGRWYEIMGEKPNIPNTVAKNWYGKEYSSDAEKTADTYDRGAVSDAPALGAILCWKDDVATGNGHVAVVEKINDDGSIVISESCWNNNHFGKANDSTDTTGYWRTRVAKNTDGNWGSKSGAYNGKTLTFQGFIYNPAVAILEETTIPTEEGTLTNYNLTASVGTPGNYISKNKALKQSEMEINARYIWNYLGSKGWTLNAVAGMLGNMQHESTINPGRGEVGAGTGYGLVQWTPGTKIRDWCASKGKPAGDMNAQLERIIWEKENGKQYSKNKYPYTFKQFAQSKDSPYKLACAFAFDYERSGVTIWGFHRKKCSKCGSGDNYKNCKGCHLKKYGQAKTDQQAEKNRQALRDLRGGSAEKWYKFLAGKVPSIQNSDAADDVAPEVKTILASYAEKFKLVGYKIDNLAPTSIKASFVTRNSSSGKYKLFDVNNKELATGELSVKCEGETQIVSFKTDLLKPNTEYKLQIEITSSVGGETRQQVVWFTTPQDYPNEVKLVELLCSEMIKSKDSEFILKVEKPEYIGYWNKNATGYDKYLYINNRPVKSKVISGIKNISNEKFTIKKEFGYECLPTDSVQIGISTWVTDDNGNKIYANEFSKTSESICLLNKQVSVCLKTN